MVVNRRRNRNKKTLNGIIGTKKSNCNLIKSASIYYDLYIGNCHTSLTIDNLKEYSKIETSIDVKDIEELQTKRKFSKSFKITTTSHERDTLLMHDVWPEGIICRKFFRPYRD